MQRVACFFESTCIAKACNDIAFIIICVTGGTICQIIGRVAIGMKDILIKYNIGACDVFQLGERIHLLQDGCRQLPAVLIGGSIMINLFTFL